MKVVLKNVGSICNGVLSIDENKINIKYGINGAGKSTLAKSVFSAINNEDLSKYITYGSDIYPQVSIDKEVKTCLSFNREYVRDYLFKDDIVHNSFEIMINTQSYRAMKEQIDKKLSSLILVVKSEKLFEIEKNIDDFLKSIKFNKPSKGRPALISRTSKFGKVSGSFVVDNLKPEISVFKDNFNDAKSPDWYKWFKDGKKYIHNNSCPFCGKGLDENYDDVYQKVIETSDNTMLKNSIDIKSIFNKLTSVANVSEKAKTITSSNEKPCDEQLIELKQIYDTFTIENKKIQNLKNLNLETIRNYFNNDNLKDFLEFNLLNESLYDSQNKEVKSIVRSLNKEIKILIGKIESLEDEVKSFSKNLSDNIVSQETEVNEMFRMAGIPYKIQVKNENGNYKTILIPVNCNVDIDKESLSYGERNAISLVLFSLEAKKSNGLIILDDPVSSFDNNKKYALLYYLFIKDNAPLKDKTVLLLTHDFNLVFDFAYKVSFRKLKAKMYYFYNDKGNVEEIRIKDEKLHYIVRYYEKRANDTSLNKIIRLVNLRKYIELIYGDMSLEFHVLSSLEHGKNPPEKRNDKGTFEIINESDTNKIIEKIKSIIADFDYINWLTEIKNIALIKEAYIASNSDVEKLQLARMYIDLNPNIQVDYNVFNFITETYHVEDNYVIVLDEKKYNQLPRFVIEYIDDLLLKN